MRDDFEDRLNSWVAGCQKIINDYFAKNYPNLKPNILSTIPGKRYVKIFSVNDGGAGYGRSAWAFIDKETGEVKKPASWKAPAKHARGNIFAPDNGLTGMGPYGPPYLK